jgi:hypothetical protein
MSSVDLPQSNNAQPGGNLEKIREEARKAAEILERKGKLPEGEKVDKLFEDKAQKSEEAKRERQEEFQKHLTKAEESYLNNDDYEVKINREDIADFMRESGVFNEDSPEKRQEKYREIWEKLKEIKYFLKFDGSGYYQNSSNKDRWKNRSAASKTSGDHSVEKMFSKFIGGVGKNYNEKGELEKYYELLQVYDDMSEVAEAIAHLESQGETDTRAKGFYNELISVGKTGEYKNVEVQEGKERQER